MTSDQPVDILLIDDEPENLARLAAMLGAIGVNLVRAMPGDAGSGQALAGDFAAILIDLPMSAARGLEVARSMRSQPRAKITPIIFLTGPDLREFPIEQAYALGAVDHLTTPVIPIVLRAKLAFLADLHRKARALAPADAERERLLSEVRAANDRMAEVFKQAPAFMCLLRGPQHVFEMINDRYLQLMGNRELVGRSVREAVPEVAGQGFHELLDGVYRTGESYVGLDMPLSLQCTPDGPREERFVDFVYMAMRGADGAVNGILAHGVDQTHRKSAELALRSSEERYRTILSSMDQGFCIVEMIFDADARPVDYRYIEMNPMFEDHTGLVDVMGKLASEVIPDLDGWWYRTLGKVAATGQPLRFENQAIGRWFDVYAARIGDERSTRVALLFSDITRRKQSEDDLRRLAADLSAVDRRRSEFLATLAHELRNPLAPLRSGLGVLRLGGDNPVVLAKTREMMDRQVTHMVRLIDDLLDIARISGGKMDIKKVRVELNTVLASAVETSLPLIEAGQHELLVEVPEASLPLNVDATRIAQVVSNLLNNAAKYTPTGGRIELSARREGDEVVVSVTDNGVGVPQESLLTIFEMFTQDRRHMGRAQGGLGIGLSLVRRLVEMHEGTVTVTSPGVGQGSCFTVRLPLAVVSNRGAAATQQAGAEDAGTGFRVLVADDNADGAEILSEVLKLFGHTTQVAHDGHAAIRVARVFRPQVAFLDIGMPGLNGYEVARALRESPGMERIVLVALTGWGAEGDRRLSRNAGFDYHLTKPAELEAIRDLFSKLGAPGDMGSFADAEVQGPT